MYLYQQPESTSADHFYAEKNKQLVRVTLDAMRALVADLASQAQASADACAASMAAIESAMAGLTTTGQQAAAIAALQSGKADLSTVSSLQEEMAGQQSYMAMCLNAIAALIEDMQAAAQLAADDRASLPLLCGQPMTLFGAGTPQEAIVPSNWRQFDPVTGTGYNWNGTPSAEGQVYINTLADVNGRYTAIRSGHDLIWKNY